MTNPINPEAAEALDGLRDYLISLRSQHVFGYAINDPLVRESAQKLDGWIAALASPTPPAVSAKPVAYSGAFVGMNPEIAFVNCTDCGAVNDGRNRLCRTCGYNLNNAKTNALSKLTAPQPQPSKAEASEALDRWHSDIFTLIGHAEGMKAEGKCDMPAYFYGLAERIARHIGDAAMAEKVAALAAQPKASTDPDSLGAPASPSGSSLQPPAAASPSIPSAEAGPMEHRLFTAKQAACIASFRSVKRS